jgi:hypothetical protein
MSEDKIARTSQTNVSIFQGTLRYEEIFGMTDIAAKAQVETAKATYEVPAKQETIRDSIKTVTVSACVLVLVALGIKFAPAGEVSGIIKIALVTMGGAWGISEVIKRLRK